MQSDKLIRLISQNGQQSLEIRQVAKRLKSLLPRRLKEIQKNYISVSKTIASANRKALADQSYENYITEFVEISSQAMKARIQYETHTMLYDARATLRAFRIQ